MDELRSTANPQLAVEPVLHFIGTHSDDDLSRALSALCGGVLGEGIRETLIGVTREKGDTPQRVDAEPPNQRLMSPYWRALLHYDEKRLDVYKRAIDF